MNGSKIGDYIKRRRKAKKLTIVKLAEMSGVSNPYISQIENNKFIPSPEILKKIANALDVPHQYLMEKAGHAQKTDRKDILQTQLLSLQEAKVHKSLEINAVAHELSRSDLDVETRNHLEKVLDNSKSEIQNLDVAIESILELIKSSELVNKTLEKNKELNKNFNGWGDLEDIPLEEIKQKLENTGYKVHENVTPKIELEVLFNSTQEITFNGKNLTDKDKQKVLQVLSITLED